ncbi:MAG: hypothetical protein AB1792_11800 [Candidatus Zixiibacteriota bacterium]
MSVCPWCREFVESVRLLDRAISEDPDCEPGALYWETLPARVQRRLVDGRQVTIRPTPSRLRWNWAWGWAPATAVAVLAFVIGRGIVREYSTPPLMESEVPVIRAVDTPAEEPSATGAKTATPEPAQPDATRTRASTRLAEGPKLSSPEAQVEKTESPSPKPAMPSAPSTDGGTPPVTSATDAVPPEQGSVVADRPTAMHQDEGRVWPKRQVTIVGQIAPDTPGQPVADELGPAAQGAFSAYERQMQGYVGSETAGTFPAPGPLLEAPRHPVPAGFADSQSPAEAMRRFDEMADLRRQIGEIQAMAPLDRSDSDQARLAALWFRLGMICQETALVDSAIQVVEEYLEVADDSGGSSEWANRRTRLQERRVSMGK